MGRVRTLKFFIGQNICFLHKRVNKGALLFQKNRLGHTERETDNEVRFKLTGKK